MDHYFSDSAAVDAARTQHKVTVAGHTWQVVGAAGVFSTGRLDPGTAVLLAHVPPPPATGYLADLGCGWGPLTLKLAVTSPAAHVVAADINPLAQALTRENAARADLPNVEVLGADAPVRLRQRGIELAGLWSNPPIRIGKQALHQLLQSWLPLLAPNAPAHLVVSKNLGADSLARWLTDNGFPTTRLASAKGFRVLETRRSSD